MFGWLQQWFSGLPFFRQSGFLKGQLNQIIGIVENEVNEERARGKVPVVISDPAAMDAAVAAVVKAVRPVLDGSLNYEELGYAINRYARR